MKRIVSTCLVLFIMGLLGGCSAPERVIETKVQIKGQGKSALSPVYAPLADYLTERFDLGAKRGVGIDLGSGRGDLIVELAKRSPGMHWINADVNTKVFAGFFNKAASAGVAERVSAQLADAKSLPYRSNYADIVVSRGSFPFWGGLEAGLNEVNRVLKPGCPAYIGRGFSENLPVEIARSIRQRQKQNLHWPNYDVDQTAAELADIMKRMGNKNYTIHRPKTAGSQGVNYGIWLEWRKE
jgi:SAM-dependent methyltransferase